MKTIRLMTTLCSAAALSAACISSVPEAQAPAGEGSAPAPTSQAASGAESGPAAPALFCGKGKSEDLLIEDMEDNDNRTIVRDKMGGYWFSYSDDKGSQITPKGNSTTTWCKPPPSLLFPMASSGANGSKHAARFNGKLVSSDGQWAGVGLGLSDGKLSCQFDASAYKGVSFWAKGPAKIRLRIPDVNSHPDGGTCQKCYNDFGADLELSPEWKEYTVPFESMTQQRGRGEEQPGLAAAKIYGLQWEVSAPGAAYDISIDDVKFLGCQ